MRAIKIIFSMGLILLMLKANAQKNLLTNGGFEDDFYGWNDGGGQITPWNIKSGKNSCAIVTTNTDKWVGIDQTVRIPKKATALNLAPG